MALEPARRVVDHSFKRARFWEQVRRARNDCHSLRLLQSRQCLLVELDHTGIGTADNQEGRRADLVEGSAGHIGPTTTGDNGADAMRKSCRRHKSGSGPGTGAKQADWKRCRLGPCLQPINDRHQAAGPVRPRHRDARGGKDRVGSALGASSGGSMV